MPSNVNRNIAGLIHCLFLKTGGTGFISTECRLSCEVNLRNPAATHPKSLVHMPVNAGCNSEQTLVLPTHQREPKLHSCTCQSTSHPDSSHSTSTQSTRTRTRTGTHFMAHFILARCVFYAASFMQSLL